MTNLTPEETTALNTLFAESLGWKSDPRGEMFPHSHWRIKLDAEALERSRKRGSLVKYRRMHKKYFCPTTNRDQFQMVLDGLSEEQKIKVDTGIFDYQWEKGKSGFNTMVDVLLLPLPTLARILGEVLRGDS